MVSCSYEADERVWFVVGTHHSVDAKTRRVAVRSVSLLLQVFGQHTVDGILECGE